jgi:hypothetical protein
MLERSFGAHLRLIWYGLGCGSDYLQEHAKGSIMYGFKGGPAGIMKCKYVELTTDFVYPYRNQVQLRSFDSVRGAHY